MSDGISHEAAPMREYVTQADRDAAGNYQRILLASGQKSRDSVSLSAFRYRNGEMDQGPLVQAFKEHRLAHTARSDAGDEVERLIRELRNPWQDGPPNIERGPLPDWAGGLLDRAAAALAAMRAGVDRGMVEEVPAVPEWLAKVLAENVARFDALPLAIKNARFSYVAAAALSRKGG